MTQASGVALGPSNVTRLEHDGKELIIVGTAHVSKRSVEEVERVIAEERPDTVCVELDETRYRMLVDSDSWRKLDVFEILREKRVFFFLTTLVLTRFQRKLGLRLGVRPGAEMLAAIRAAEAIGAKVVLADRDISATLKRSFRNLSAWNRTKLLVALIVSSFSSHEISEEQVEQLKDRDTIGEMMKLFAQEMPELQVPLIDERDRYLMSSVQEATGPRIVAVVGAGHVDGMKRHLGGVVDRAALSVVPPPSAFSKMKKWILPLAVAGAFMAGYRRHGTDGLYDMLLAFAVPSALGAALSAVAAGAKWFTALGAFVLSPFASFCPVIGAGTLAGFLDAWNRKPNAGDSQRLPEDLLTLRGLYGNAFARVLLVSAAVSIGGALGAMTGGVLVFTLL